MVKVNNYTFESDLYTLFLRFSGNELIDANIPVLSFLSKLLSYIIQREQIDQLSEQKPLFRIAATLMDATIRDACEYVSQFN